MNDEIDYFEGIDGEESDKEPATLVYLSKLAKNAKSLSDEIEKDGIALKEKQDRLNKIVRDLIPTAMDELGIKNFTLDDDSKVDIKEKISARISEDNKTEAFKWLIDNNFDGIIKTKVISEFGKGEATEAQKALDSLIESGFNAYLDKNVHPMTLMSFVKERLEEGDDIPLDVFGVYEFKEAKITPPKTKRTRLTR